MQTFTALTILHLLLFVVCCYLVDVDQIFSRTQKGMQLLVSMFVPVLGSVFVFIFMSYTRITSPLIATKSRELQIHHLK